MKRRPIGQRVKITRGPDEFIGQRGTIIDNREMDGLNVMYRVRLDTPVIVEGVGLVEDDIWQGAGLRCLEAGRK